MMEFQKPRREPLSKKTIPSSAPPVPPKLFSGVAKNAYTMPNPRRPVAAQRQSGASPKPRDGTGTEIELEEPILATADRKPTPISTRLQNIIGGYWRSKWWSVPLTILVVLILVSGAVFAYPGSRYAVLGQFVQRSVDVILTDSGTGTPVSGATVTLDGQTKVTNGSGATRFTAPIGNGTLKVAKSYYKDTVQSIFVDMTATTTTVKVSLVATGRQVPVKVLNKITGKPIPEAVITVGASAAKTDLSGLATLVVAGAGGVQQGKVSVDGYNDLPINVQVSTTAVDANTFTMVPVGRLFFLSNLSGKIDVVSTRLDGSDRKTVLAGTGSEDKTSTVLLATRDWQYLALLTKRDGGDHPKLFLLSAATGKQSLIDDTATDYTLIGWSGHSFVFQEIHADMHSWQSGTIVVKSYNADASQPITLVSSSATGTSDADSHYESIMQANFISGTLVYAKTWYRYPGYVGVSGQQNTLMSIKPDGTDSKILKSVDASQYYISSLKLVKPNQLYFGVFDITSASANYYSLDDRGNSTQSDTVTGSTVSQSYPTYLLSPSGHATFWGEVHDGKNALLVGDFQGIGGSTIARLGDYSPYGWYSDDYLLMQKNKSELYLLPVAGGTPLKVSDYFKPEYYLSGYGGSYGGL